MDKLKYITLKHLLIDGKKQIGLQYFKDKVIDALVLQIEGVEYNEQFKMYYVLNSPFMLAKLFRMFKGIAWLNTKYFFRNKPTHKGAEILDISGFRERHTDPGYITCPESFLRKLELRKYIFNTARTYISCLKKFINFYSNQDVDSLDENDIRVFIQELIREGKSDSTINQSINAIKFYYEVVRGMPNRFYNVERPRKRKDCQRSCLRTK